MSVKTYSVGTGSMDNYVLQEALSAYSDEAYTNAKKLSGTGIVGGNPMIDTGTETFVGQIRWNRPLNPKINVASLTDETPGLKTNFSQDYLRYIKTVRTHGAEKINLASLVTQVDGLAKVGRDFGETRAQDEHNAILAVLRGVMISEAIIGTKTGAAGGQDWDNDPTSNLRGFYVDMGNANPLVVSPADVGMIGAQRAQLFLESMGKAWKDYEPEWAYLICDPQTMASLRSANLVDSDRVTDGNVQFNTIFQGKLRLIQTRASMGLSATELAKINTGGGSTDISGTKCSFIVLPGALAMEPLAVPDPTEIQRDAKAYKGGGTTAIWYRWGYVLAPAGYDWQGYETFFPSDNHDATADPLESCSYCDVWDDDAIEAGVGDWTSLAAATDAKILKGVWGRKAQSVLSLGILPVFHG